MYGITQQHATFPETQAHTTDLPEQDEAQRSSPERAFPSHSGKGKVKVAFMKCNSMPSVGGCLYQILKNKQQPINCLLMWDQRYAHSKEHPAEDIYSDAQSKMRIKCQQASYLLK